MANPRVEELDSSDEEDGGLIIPDLPTFQPPKLVKCRNCRRMLATGIKRCSKCKEVAYCGEECQRKHWPFHKDECREPIKTDDEKHEEAKEEFKKNYEEPTDDSIETMLRKVAVQTKTMQLVAGPGTRQVKRSVKKEDGREKNDWELRSEWAAHKYCSEMVGSNDHLPPPGWRDLEKYKEWRASADCPHFPANICKPTMMQPTGRREEVDVHEILPLHQLGLRPVLVSADNNPNILATPMFPVVVRTPLLFPFLCGERCEPYMSSWDLIDYYTKAFYKLSSQLQVPEQIVKQMDSKRRQLCNAVLGIFKLLHFHLEQKHTSGEMVARVTCRTNWLANGHMLHALENMLLSTLNVTIDQDHHYISPDPDKYEVKADEIPPDVLKRVRSQTLDVYTKLVSCMTQYPNFEDEFRYESPKSDKEYPYRHLISRKGSTVLLDLVCRVYKMSRVDESEGTMMSLDGDLMDMIERAEIKG